MPLKHYNFKNDYENKDEIMRILPKLNDNINLINLENPEKQCSFNVFSSLLVKLNRIKL